MLPILPLRINRTDLGLSVKIVLRKQSLRQIFIFGFLSETQTEVCIARVRWPGGVVGVGASRHLYKGKAEMADALTTSEAIVGQLYVTVLIARLVALHMLHSRARESGSLEKQ